MNGSPHGPLPITGDLPDEQRRRAAWNAVCVAARCRGTREEAEEFLEALGLQDQIRVLKAAQIASAASDPRNQPADTCTHWKAAYAISEPQQGPRARHIHHQGTPMTEKRHRDEVVSTRFSAAEIDQIRAILDGRPISAFIREAALAAAIGATDDSPMKTCQTCGAAVRKPNRHAAWHIDQKPAATDETFASIVRSRARLDELDLVQLDRVPTFEQLNVIHELIRCVRDRCPMSDMDKIGPRLITLLAKIDHHWGKPEAKYVDSQGRTEIES